MEQSTECLLALTDVQWYEYNIRVDSDVDLPWMQSPAFYICRLITSDV